MGVLSGLEVSRHYSEEGVKPKKTLYVVDWADEEGARYGYSCLGSSAATGTLKIEEFIDRKDANGVLFEDAVINHKLDIETFLDANKEFKAKLGKLKAYLEFHIEQDPVLEQSGKDASSVYGAAGVGSNWSIFTSHYSEQYNLHFRTITN